MAKALRGSVKEKREEEDVDQKTDSAKIEEVAEASKEAEAVDVTGTEASNTDPDPEEPNENAAYREIDDLINVVGTNDRKFQFEVVAKPGGGGYYANMTQTDNGYHKYWNFPTKLHADAFVAQAKADLEAKRRDSTVAKQDSMGRPIITSEDPAPPPKYGKGVEKNGKELTIKAMDGNVISVPYELQDMVVDWMKGCEASSINVRERDGALCIITYPHCQRMWFYIDINGKAHKHSK